jgi:hypothetical protein
MLKKIAMAVAVVWSLVGNALAAEAGRVVFVTGDAQLGRHAAVKDAVVEEGDQISTGSDGYVYVQTVDNGFLILRPNTVARVAAYAIDKNDPSKTQVKLELSQGVARAISGEGVKRARQNFRFNTPVAAIGVRGTDFTVYTDQQTTRVTVLSGGVVMSGFGAGCAAAGTGPCEGRNARELFAGQDGMLLQVERGNSIPQLLANPALAPDQAEKPRGDEPATKPTAAPLAQVNLDPQRSAQALRNVRPVPTAPAPAPDPTPVQPVPPPVTGPGIPPPVVVEPPRPPVAAVPEVFWGRWQAVLNRAPAIGRIGDADVDIATYYGPYAITRLSNSALVMPKEGTAAFRLMGGEAIMTNSDGDRFATIDAGQLTMDFGKKTFATSLVVNADGDRANVVGSGIMTDKGMLYEDRSSDTIIRGYLGGANADQAGYIFKNYANPGVVVSGATSWSR